MKLVPANLCLALVLAAAPPSHADIFQWEYVNPADPSQGKQPSTILAPDGAGVNAVPGADLSYRNLTKAYLVGADLSPSYFCNLEECITNHTYLVGATLAQADLTNARLDAAFLTGADLTGAEVRGASFYRASSGGITAAQLYSTASYQARDMSRIKLDNNNLDGINLIGQNLTNASFVDAQLTGANFTGAEVRGANFYGHRSITAAQLYSTASYQAHDLTGITLGGIYNTNFVGLNLAGQILTNASFAVADLTGANLTGAEVRGAYFAYSTLTDADFTGAEVHGANFGFFPGVGGTGITAAQLYSTASYRDHDLTGINLSGHDLTGVNLAGQNLSNASFYRAKLTGANLTGAVVRGAYFGFSAGVGGTGITAAQLYSTASYQDHDLTGINLSSHDLTGANLAGQNLTNASFDEAKLTGANLAGAEVRGASFTKDGANGTGLTPVQLYSTASYQARNLTGIRLNGSNLAGVDLAGQNLMNADFHASGTYTQTNLTGANLSQANLTNVKFYGHYEESYGLIAGANLTGANLSGADARGANFELATLTGANTTNLIQTDGHIAGLNLTASKLLVVRDYDGGATTDPLPIVVDQHLAMDSTGTLRLVFDADDWGSSISFAPGVSVVRNGTLELTFAPDVNVASQLGRTINLFDWTGVAPTGEFNVSSAFTWDLSKLYTTGEVTLAGVGAGLAGDFNGDSVVNAADLAEWKRDFGVNAHSDADGDGDSDGADFLTWQRQLDASTPGQTQTIAAVPEPPTIALASGAILSLLIARATRSRCFTKSPRNFHAACVL